jgi:hypothetical protein
VMLTNNQPTALGFSFGASGSYAVSSTGTTCGASLASKAKCNIAVTFSPKANGSVNGALSLTDGTSFSPQLVGLTGTGSGGGTSPLTFNPATAAFGTQVAGTSSAAKTVQIKNTSGAALTLNSLAASADFSVVGSGATPCAGGLLLNANATCAMSVTFSPALGASGNLLGSILVTDTAAIGQQAANLNGSATLPLTVAPATLSFAGQIVASSSAAQTVTITNNLAATANLAIAGGGEFAAMPGGATPCGATLASHAQCTWNVTFTPSGVGNRAGSITITSSGNPAVQTVGVTGTGQ